MPSQSKGHTPSDLLKSITVDRHLLDELAAQGVIDQDTRLKSLGWLHPPHEWARWAMLLLLAFGSGLVLAGIVFFFAFNWASIPDLVKLAMIESGIVITAGLSWFLSLERFLSRLLLLSAAVLTGVFLAVFGQIYQTGADQWQFFALWAALITIWTVIARFLSLWVLWLGLVNLSLFLFWSNEPGLRDAWQPLVLLAQAGLNGAFLLARELLAPSAAEVRQSRIELDFEWLSPQWTRWLLLAGMLLFLFPTMMIWVSDWQTSDMIIRVSALGAALLSALLFIAHRYWRPDVAALALLMLMICILAVIAFAVILFDNVLESIGTTFFTAVFAIISFAGAAAYLRHLLSLDIEARGGQ
ncbi:DUF2157 domain-containing protein [uncultured Cohaesibacter sp.]|uniref:DUF2157 domain-containing protein n=1 Tax=uncultured Cohaesibacter sp. TaxID=1002546 RepID=UPI00293113CA|nr:DUF2157 domain-containing protein [uncultured Cohaesibacter sp.]